MKIFILVFIIAINPGIMHVYLLLVGKIYMDKL